MDHQNKYDSRALKRYITPPVIASFSPAAGTTVPKQFNVFAMDVKDPSGVAYVQFAVWSAAGGQDDLKFYSGVEIGNGNWRLDGDVRNHMNGVGKYYIDVYAADREGNRGYYGTTTAVVQ